MYKFVIFIAVLIFCNVTNYAAPNYANVGDVTIHECQDIVSHGKFAGDFGNRSTGLSYGTHVSTILLAFQEVYIENHPNFIKTSDATKDKSIYSICRSALAKYYSNEKLNFVVLLQNEVLDVNKSSGLVVFSTLDEIK